MYLEYYGLTALPFELTPNPKFLLLAPAYREALGNLRYGIESGKGLTLLVGAAGTGKTTLLRAVLAEIGEAKTDVCTVSNPTLSRDEFVERLAMGFGLSAEAARSKTAMLAELETALRARLDEGRRAALIVDEAQALSDELLEEIRLLSNLETDEAKLLPIVLAGHPELSERLNRPAFAQIKQRVALRCELRPLDLHHTAAYIASRARQAGGDSSRLFTRDAVTLIHERARGVPRLINVLCDNALVTGFAADRRPITRDMVEDVCRDFDLCAPEPSPSTVPGSGSEPPAAVQAAGRMFRFF